MSFAHGQDVFRLTVPSDPQSLAMVRAVVEAAGKLAGHDEKSRYEVVLAVHEACSNVIRHAHADNRQLPITLECRVSNEGLEFRLQDKGAPFDFEAVPELDPSEIRKGGRGVFLIRRYFDEVSCQARPEGGNELRMFKRSRPSSE